MLTSPFTLILRNHKEMQNLVLKQRGSERLSFISMNVLIGRDLTSRST